MCSYSIDIKVQAVPSNINMIWSIDTWSLIDRKFLLSPLYHLENFVSVSLSKKCWILIGTKMTQHDARRVIITFIAHLKISNCEFFENLQCLLNRKKIRVPRDWGLHRCWWRMLEMFWCHFWDAGHDSDSCLQHVATWSLCYIVSLLHSLSVT